MTLLKTVSERLDNHGVPFIDLYLGWKTENGEFHFARIRPQFYRDNYFLLLNAVEVPKGEKLEDYL